MLYKKIAISLIFIAITTFSNQSSAQTLDHLPGYKFNPKNIPFLSAYKITSDNINFEGRDVVGIQREITFQNNNSIISIYIHIAQNKTPNASSIIKNIINNRFLSTGFAYNKKDHKKIGIGEVLYASVLGPINGKITSRVLFSRNNVIIKILNKTTTGPKPNIEPLAKQIDKDIDNKVKVTLKEIEAYKPIIEKFNLDKKDIKEYTQTKLTIDIKDPNKKNTQFFYETKGDIIEENGQYLFDSPIKLGKDTLTIVVVNDHLLYSEKTIEFTVIK